MTVSNVFIILVVLSQSVDLAQAGHCFSSRIHEICYELTAIDVTEQQCTSPFYSDDVLVELDGYVYAEKCREVNTTLKRCDVDCGLGQECQWIDGEEMCVCSPESCLTSNVANQSVCASNNKTFQSECAMEAWKCMNHQSGLYKKYDGECRKDCRDVKCSDEKICVLVKNTGEPICYPKKHCVSSGDDQPVCGTNGITYRNLCAMRLSTNRQGRTPDLAHRGACEKTCRDDLCQPSERCVYSKQSRPICIRCQFVPGFFINSGECSMSIPACGDDGRLYSDYCSVLRSQCEKNQFINIIDYQTCPSRMRKQSSTTASKSFHRFGYRRLN